MTQMQPMTPQQQIAVDLLVTAAGSSAAPVVRRQWDRRQDGCATYRQVELISSDLHYYGDEENPVHLLGPSTDHTPASQRAHGGFMAE